MPIRLDCPRCKTPLAVPNKKVGGYANCPHCGGRFWVPKPGSSDTMPAPPPQGAAGPPAPPASAAGTGNSLRPGPPAPPPATGQGAWLAGPGSAGPPGVRGPSSGDGAMVAASQRSAPAQPPPPTVPPPRKVARFITAESTESALKLAEDGKLPELRLKEPGREEAETKGNRSSNPLVLLVVLSLSVVMSTVLVLVDFEPRNTTGLEEAHRARRVIEEQYFANLDPNQPLAPYQIDLREAARAHSIGDRKTEQERYRKVLAMLRAERGRFERGLTGSPYRDQELERQITIVLSHL